MQWAGASEEQGCLCERKDEEPGEPEAGARKRERQSEAGDAERDEKSSAAQEAIARWPGSRRTP